MMNHAFGRLLLIALILAVAWTATWVYGGFRRTMRAATARVNGVGRVVETSYGPVEYAEIGSGPPVLIAHGAGGGFDQGMLAARNVGGHFRYIVPSRFGYLGSALPAKATPQLQADVYAQLLDKLKLDRVAVVGISAGGPSALQFALRHPKRCSALVMVSAASCNDVPPRTTQGELPFRLMESDLVFWGLETAFRSRLLSFFGLPQEIQAGLTSEQKKQADLVIATLLPMSKRVRGMRFDIGAMYSNLSAYPIERITAPTLVVHAKDDYFVRFSHGQNTAGRIPRARLFAPERGGHLVVAINQHVQAEIRAFLEDRH